MSLNAFERLSPFIKEFIYRNSWEELREVQVEACRLIFETDSHVLLAASTASGKTEAAFFPILTLLEENPPSTIGALYIGPLKALINNQFERLNELLEATDIPVWHWHGDVDQSEKSKVLMEPRGILQITPESLECMLERRMNEIPRMFGDLRFIILDEAHVFMGSDRGSQVLCLLERLQRVIGTIPRRVGLSATFADYSLAEKWLASGTDKITETVNITQGKTRWNLALEQFFIDSDYDVAGGQEVKKDFALEPSYNYIYNNIRKKSIIFTNSRKECEIIMSAMRQIAKKKNEPDIFYIHHGNISTGLRGAAEEGMRNPEILAVTSATATLELGVDIGQLERIISLSSPQSVATLLQRLGRSGRRGFPPEMFMIFREQEFTSDSAVYDIIPWRLLQAVALIQLYVEERWIGPPSAKKYPFSLLYHQTMSSLVTYTELSPSELAKRVLTLTPFKDISVDDFKFLLKHLIEIEHIQLVDNGNLIIGLAAERMVNNFKFYAVFSTEDEYSVRYLTEDIGTIYNLVPVGERLALAGQSWEVLEIDEKKRLVNVRPVEGQMTNAWKGFQAEVHTRVLEKMREILESEKQYVYLKPNAAKRLEDARRITKLTGLTRDNPVSLGGDRYCLFPWLGTRSFRTLARFIKGVFSNELELSNYSGIFPYYMTFRMGRSKEFFGKYINNYISRRGLPLEQAASVSDPYKPDKYDEFIPQELILKSSMYDRICVEEIPNRVKEWL